MPPKNPPAKSRPTSRFRPESRRHGHLRTACRRLLSRLACAASAVELRLNGRGYRV